MISYCLPALSYNLGVHHKKCVVGVNTCGTEWQREGQVWIDDGKARSGATELCCSHCCFQAVYCQTVLEAVTLRLGSWAPKQNSLVFFIPLSYSQMHQLFEKATPENWQTKQIWAAWHTHSFLLEAPKHEYTIYIEIWPYSMRRVKVNGLCWTLPLPQWFLHPQLRGRALAISQEKQFQ